MRKSVVVLAVLAILAILPAAAFADFGIGAAAFGKSPVLVGQSNDTNNLNVSQFSFGGDMRLKLSLFQAEALVLYASGNGVNSFNTYLDAGVAVDLSILRLSLGAGPNFIYNSGANSGAQVGLNVKAGADVMLGQISFGLSYIMAMNIANGVQIATNSGLLGVSVMFWL
jgi:hypothetical protein